MIAARPRAAPPPAGFEYRADFPSAADERQLLEKMQALEVGEFEFHGFPGKRRVSFFGWRYGFGSGGLQKADAKLSIRTGDPRATQGPLGAFIIAIEAASPR